MLAPAAAHVLLAEDDADSAEALLMVLGRAGYDAQWVDRARDALARLREGPRPDVLLLDLTLADIGGATLVREFVAAAPLPPTIVISASPESTLRDAAQQLRACAALRKPFGTDALMQAIAQALPARDHRA